MYIFVVLILVFLKCFDDGFPLVKQVLPLQLWKFGAVQKT